LAFASRSRPGQAFFRAFAAGREGLAALTGFGGDSFEGFCRGGGVSFEGLCRGGGDTFAGFWGGGGDTFAGFCSGGGDAFAGFCGGGGDSFADACFSARELLLRTVPNTRRGRGGGAPAVETALPVGDFLAVFPRVVATDLGFGAAFFAGAATDRRFSV